MTGLNSSSAAGVNEHEAPAASTQTPRPSDVHPSPVIEAWLNRADEGFRRMAQDPAYLAEVSKRIS